MKKLISILTMAIIAISSSICVLAASSPSGEVKPDKFNIIGNAGQSVSIIVLDQGEDVKVDSNGAFRLDSVTAGEHIITFKSESKELGNVKINVNKGTETKFTSISEGNYDISVAANITTIKINFDIKDDKIVITKVDAAGNDSAQSPETGNMSLNLLTVMLLVSFVGIVSCIFVKKRHSL